MSATDTPPVCPQGQCPQCGGPLPPKKPVGRPRVFCSARCRVAHFRAAAVARMRARRCRVDAAAWRRTPEFEGGAGI